MDPTIHPRLHAWLDRSEIVALDPPRIETLARSLDDADPPVRVERWGTVVGYEAGPPRRRLVQFDRHGHLIAACRWAADGSLAWARCRAADGRWIGVEPGAGDHRVWGRSDRVWQLDGAEPWQPVEMLTVFRALDWARLDHIPPLAEPRRLPGGAGSAVLNLLAALMKDQGLPRTRYRGPFPTEQLFTSLLESFRHGIEKVVADGVTFYRTEWQGIKRREPRVIREDGERVVCSLWALGGPLEDRLILDRSGEVVEAPPPQAREVAPAPLAPVWNRALADLIARESAPALGSAIVDVLAAIELEWGAVPGELVRVWTKRVRLSAELRDAATASLRSAEPGRERAEQALRFVLEVARLLGPEVRGRAQALLEALPEEGQAQRLEAAEQEPEALDPSVGRLIALLAR